MKHKIRALCIFAFFISSTASAAIVSNAATLAGIDANQDGVRDDVYENYIDTYSQTEAKKAAYQYAKSFQEIMKINVSNLEDVKSVKERINRATGCVYVTFANPKFGKHPARLVTEIKNATLDTGERLQAFYRFNKALESVKVDQSNNSNC